LKIWNTRMFGTKYGDPITQYVETEVGPYSMGQQFYKNPDQTLICELQGYLAKNVTVTFAHAIWNPKDLNGVRTCSNWRNSENRSRLQFPI
jgi:hypothetical protein